jgi:hypothetical protein
MRTSIFKGLLVILLFLGITPFSLPAGADTFTTLTLPTLNTNISASTWADGATYNSIFPGSYNWHGVPFILEDRNPGDNKVFYESPGYGFYSLTIPANVYGVTKAYTIINTARGSIGSIVGEVKFYGTGSAYYQMDLTEGINVRDHYRGYYNNVIDNINALPAVDNGSWRAGLDMQIYTLPSVFATETLQYIVFTGYGYGDAGEPFIAAATVSSAPLPGAVWLMGSGLVGLSGLRRFRKS